MKKIFQMQDLDCANCAAKMEALIKRIPGVRDVSVNFMTQKLTLTAEDERFDEIVAEAQRCCAKVDRGCRIVG